MMIFFGFERNLLKMGRENYGLGLSERLLLLLLLMMMMMMMIELDGNWGWTF